MSVNKVIQKSASIVSTSEFDDNTINCINRLLEELKIGVEISATSYDEVDGGDEFISKIVVTKNERRKRN